MQKKSPKSLTSELKLCTFTKNLNPLKQSKQNGTIGNPVFNIWKQIQIDHRLLYYVRLSSDNGKQCLFRCRSSNQKKRIQQTPWIVQITTDNRYIWRASKKIDMYDVKNLLQFILTKRQRLTKQKQQSDNIDYCPTIVINAGSHGLQNGANAFDCGNQQLLNQNIIDQTQQAVAKLLIQSRQYIELTTLNIINKIHINDISLEKFSIYPIKANHIIDCHSSGAHSMIKAKYLQPSGKSHQQKDLLFLFQPNNIEQLMFWQSSIIRSKNDQEKLLSFFGGKNKVKHVNQLFKASDHGFQLNKFLKKCGHYPHLLIICITNKDKIIGAYSPLSHLNFNQQNFKKTETYIGDESKSSFIFSLTQDHKFELKKQKYAVLRRNEIKYICFGNDEFRICDYSNTNNDCMTLINNGGYYNEKYKLSNHWYFDKESCVRLNGNQSVNFTTKQWEAWRIEIKQ